MGDYAKIIRKLKTSSSMSRITELYGSSNGMLVEQTARYTRMLKKHEELYDADGKLYLISAPGRIEIAGNHTDHNNGKVLAAAVNRDAASIVSKRDDNIVNLYSEGYGSLSVNLNNVCINKEEYGTTKSLLKGVAHKMQELGFKIGGFDAVVLSTVLSGSGLSSSASVEVLFCTIFDNLYNNGDIDPMLRAQISQYAENIYFGKPSGLMDQSASSIGGLIFIDYKENVPIVKNRNFDFAKHGYSIVIVNTRSSHDDLTSNYAAIPKEMKEIAAYFGEDVLRRIRPEQLMQNIGELHEKFGERPILRAIHFFNENKRVVEQLEALSKNDLLAFFNSVKESGRSSFMYLQNIYANENSQPMALALALAESVLSDDGAWRVHGGGFAGTTLNFVPQKSLSKFINLMELAFGEHCCSALSIRPEGAALIDVYS